MSIVPRLSNPAVSGEKKIWVLLKGIRKQVKRKTSVYFVCLVCLFCLGRTSLSQSKFSPLTYWGPPEILGSLTLLGVSWTAGSSIWEAGLRALPGEHLRPCGWPSGFPCFVAAGNGTADSAVKSYFKMVRSDPKVWPSSCLSQAFGVLHFSAQSS